MTWGVLALCALTTYRLTRLVTTDELTESWRQRVRRRWPGGDLPRLPVRFVYCAWCVSVWVALPVLVAAHFAGLLPSWQLLALAWLAVATVAGLLSWLGG